MYDKLEEFYRSHIQNLPTYLPDGLIPVDLNLLKDMDLLKESVLQETSHHLPQCMYAVETNEKITLYNDFFVAWIIPKAGEETESTKKEPETTLLIGTLTGDEPQLEIGFSFQGIYNQSKTILRILDKAIFDIRDTEKELGHIIAG